MVFTPQGRFRLFTLFLCFFYPKRGESQIKRVVHTHFPSFLRPHNPWITADDFWLSTILISHRNPDFIVTEFLQLDSFLFLSCWQSNLRYDRCRPYFDIRVVLGNTAFTVASLAVTSLLNVTENISLAKMAEFPFSFLSLLSRT